MGRGVIKDPPPEQAKIFNQESPAQAFSDLVEIGKGNFGAVYQAKDRQTGDVIAVKRVTIPKGFGSPEWDDIHNEILVLKSCAHENIVSFKGCYRQGLEIWMAMEYCIGSCCDLMDVFKSPLAEMEIAEIVCSVVKALRYLHSDNKMHRDLKAGNILLTKNGVVKLADFGSASTSQQANSFIGTPYWMSPEVIMAMEAGTYDGKVDIWSLGITCYELAHRRPPLFEMNAMSALYHIPQNDPPRIEGGTWTDNFKDFVACCLRKEVELRPTAVVLQEHPFIASANKDPSILFSLVERAGNPELLAKNQMALEKVVQQASNLPGATASGAAAAGTTVPAINEEEPEEDEDEGDGNGDYADGSEDAKSDATDEDRDESSGAASAAPVSKGSPPVKGPAAADETPLQRARTMRRVSQRNFAAVSDVIATQLKQIKLVRGEETKQLRALQARQDADLIQLSTQESKDYEALLKSQKSEFDKLRARQVKLVDAFDKQQESEEKRQAKHVKELESSAWSDFHSDIKAQEKAAKERLKETLGDAAKDRKKAAKEGLKDRQATERAKAEAEFKAQLEAKTALNWHAFKMSRLPLRHALEFQNLEEEVKLVLKHTEATINFKKEHRSAMDATLRAHLEERYSMQMAHLDKLIEVELSQAEALEKASAKALRKQQLAELKKQPRTIRASEAKLKKMHTDTLKIQQKQSRQLQRQLSETLSKEEQAEALRVHREQQTLRMAQLEEQYRTSLAEVVESHARKLKEKHESEWQRHTTEHGQAMGQLKALQSYRRQHLAEKHKELLAYLEAQEAALAKELSTYEASEAEACRLQKKRLEELKARQEAERRDLEAQQPPPLS